MSGLLHREHQERLSKSLRDQFLFYIYDRSFTLFKLDRQLRVMALTDRQDRKIVFWVFSFFNKLHLKRLRHHCEDDFENGFGERFSETDPFATAERKESIRITPGALRSSWEWILRVKPVRQELIWPLPVASVPMKAIHIDRDNIISKNCDVVG